MNKEELKSVARKVEWAVNFANQNGDIDRSLAIDLRYLVECIDKLDEPQKPIIPQFVADYIEKWEHEGMAMSEWLYLRYDNEEEDEVSKWLYDNNYEENTRREYLLIDAIRYGYEVYREKNYEVIIGRGSLGGYQSVVVLYKSAFGRMVLKEMLTKEYEESKQRVPTSFWLTEKEIKDYDKRYWVFAEEVTQ